MHTRRMLVSQDEGIAENCALPGFELEARVRIELTYKGFADLSLTTWVPRPAF